MQTVYGKNDVLMSHTSWCQLTVDSVDFLARMYTDSEGRAVPFDQCHRIIANCRTIGTIAYSAYGGVESKTTRYILAANEALGVNFFNHTVFNSDGRLFASGEINEGEFLFVDLEDPNRTVYTLAELQALETDQNWIVL